jgi:indole-3-glycerol phosphate synthase
MTAFLQALLSARRPVIMEVKRQDADGNDLLGGRAVTDVVAGYEAAGAPCLSVVTGRWFGGTPDLLRDVTTRTDLPVLQKDFITRPGQLADARDLGASAVLLTAGLLPRAALPKLVDATLALGLTPFVEVATEAEVDAVPRPDECVIAVNNKDIATREREAADTDRSATLLPALLRRGTPCPVSASGIDGPETAARLLGLGYAGLLVATGLLRSGDAAAWMADLDRRRATAVGPTDR